MNDLEEIARKLRTSLLKTSAEKRIPHLGSCMSCVELLVYIYWEELRIQPTSPEEEGRDRFILSKGHASPILLQTLALRGFFGRELLDQFGMEGSYFHEHPPKPGLIKGVEAATGSLGHGFSMGLGMALADRIKDNGARTYIIVGDGEMNEGTIWEGAMFAAAQELENVTVIIDNNGWQATDKSRVTLGTRTSIQDKWESFGWHCTTIDGHNYSEIKTALIDAKQTIKQPSAIIATTTKGKGVSFMEDDNNWHYKIPNANELELAINELNRVELKQ